MKIRIPTLHCNRCGHDWVPRVAKVFICPKCKSAKWNEPPPKAEKKEEP